MTAFFSPKKRTFKVSYHHPQLDQEVSEYVRAASDVDALRLLHAQLRAKGFYCDPRNGRATESDPWWYPIKMALLAYLGAWVVATGLSFGGVLAIQLVQGAARTIDFIVPDIPR